VAAPSTELSVLIPVLRRPANVAAVLDSIVASGIEADYRVVFVTTTNDFAEHAAVDAQRGRGDVEVRHLTMAPTKVGDYAKKINFAASSFESTWYFCGADDLCFHPGWFAAAMAAHAETGCLVVGTNDLGNSRVTNGEHSTHSLVHRDYVALGTIDGPGVLHEGYAHCYVDDEFVQTAIHRGEFVSATSSVVEHLHPDWGKGDRRNDAAYQISRRSMTAGAHTFARRRRLWGGGGRR
jgi:hypothetical protein